MPTTELVIQELSIAPGVRLQHIARLIMDDAPPVEPPPPPPVITIPRPPPLPVRRASDWLYESWARGIDTTRWKDASNASQSTTGMMVVNDPASGPMVRAFIDHEREQRPDGTGARLFYTNSGRWDTLAPYVGKTLYFRWWTYLPEAFALTPGEGQFCEFGLQYKPGDQVVALNVAPEANGLRPWLWHPKATRRSPDTAFRYPVGAWCDHVLKVKLSTGDDGALEWTINGQVVASNGGVTCAPAGAGWGLVLYSNAVKQARGYFGGLMVATEAW